MSFFDELKRRNVIRVGLAYVVVGWLTAQVAEFATENFGAPEWVLKIYVVFLILGLPFVLIFAWAFEMTPEGIKKEKDVDRSQSITKSTGRKLDFTIIGVLVLVAAYFVWESRFQNDSVIPAKAGTSSTSVENNVSAETSVADNVGQSTSGANSIAVLPFANRSNVEDDMFFTDGIHDDLLTQLAKISNLRVISRTSVMEYRDTTKKIPEIAAELNVSTILEGGIQRAGNRIRINAQLINVATDEHLWAETFDREMTVENIFDIQSEITRQIVNAVRGELTDEETDALAQLPTSNLKAYEAYLQAKAFLNDPVYSQNRYIKAEPWLKKAVELDPQFAVAWAQLVTINGQAIWLGYDDSPERHKAAKEALREAQLHGPGLPETLAAEGAYKYRIESDFHAAEPLYAAANRAKPGDPRLLRGMAMTERRTGHFEQAITHLQVAIELDPANLGSHSLLVETLNTIGEFERAEPLLDLWIEKFPNVRTFKISKAELLLRHYGDVEAANKILESLEPGLGPAYQTVQDLAFLYARDYQGRIDFWTHPPMTQLMDSESDRLFIFEALGMTYGMMGDMEKAQSYTRQAIESGSAYQSANKNNMAYAFSARAQAYANAGEFDKALEAANKARAFKPESADSLEGPVMSNTYALVLGMAGRRDEALAEIERLLDTPGGLNRWDLYLNPYWDFFRDDERFNNLIQPENLPEPSL